MLMNTLYYTLYANNPIICSPAAQRIFIARSAHWFHAMVRNVLFEINKADIYVINNNSMYKILRGLSTKLLFILFV